MDELVYDGSFAGFLCALAEGLRSSRTSDSMPHIRARGPQTGLFDEFHAIDTQQNTAQAFWSALRRVTVPGSQTCHAAFCSDHRTVDTPLAKVIGKILASGPEVLDDVGESEVADVLAASRRTLMEAHRFQGLVRFSELADSSWYSAIKPECDILPFIAEHFSARFRNMSFIIHDIRRSKAILYVPGEKWRIAQGFQATEDSARISDLPISQSEIEIRQGWLRYFKSISIGQRVNPRLQMAHMPKKYWEFLPETEGSGSPGSTTSQQASGHETSLPTNPSSPDAIEAPGNLGRY